MKRVRRSIVAVSQDVQAGSLTIVLACHHEFTISTDRLWLGDLYDHYHRRQRTGQRLRCKECEQEGAAHE